MQLWHLTYSSRTRHALFPSEQLRRAALRRLLQVVAAEVVLFCLVDDHLHLVLCCDEARAALLGRSVRLRRWMQPPVPASSLRASPRRSPTTSPLRLASPLPATHSPASPPDC